MSEILTNEPEKRRPGRPKGTTRGKTDRWYMSINFNMEEDAELVAFLKSIPSKTAYVRAVLIHAMELQKAMQEALSGAEDGRTSVYKNAHREEVGNDD